VTTQRVPRGLATGGKRLWRKVTGEYELTGAELELLLQAARTVDELDQLESALAGGNVITTGSRGQAVANPLLAQVRQHRATLGRLITALGLPDDEAPAQPTAASLRASDAAQRRWRTEKHRRAQRGTA
jgi:hypothetical protein